MFSAIIHKKGIHHAFNEDALTSLVFDTMRFLPPPIICSFLATAKNLKGKQLRKVLSLPQETPEFKFWPPLSAGEKSEINCIPDLVMYWKNFVIVEESKWESPKSGVGLDEEGETVADPKQEADKRKRLLDQLAREVLSAEKIAQEYLKLPDNFDLLYVTDDLFMPESDVRESLDTLKKYKIDPKAYEDHIFWTNWHNLTEVLMKNKSGMADDLYQALGILGINLPFTGFNFKFNRLDRGILDQEFMFFESKGGQFQGFDFIDRPPKPDASLIRSKYLFYQGGKND